MVNLTEKHRKQILDLYQHGDYRYIYGSKLQALHRLIQSKGEKVATVPTNLNWHGTKALYIGEGYYIGMAHKPAKKGRFFPCVTKKVLYQDKEYCQVKLFNPAKC